jgi:hypothetical protein
MLSKVSPASVLCEGDSKSIRNLFLSAAGASHLLTVGSIETREPTCGNTARGDLEIGASVAFGL